MHFARFFLSAKAGLKNGGLSFPSFFRHWRNNDQIEKPPFTVSFL